MGCCLACGVWRVLYSVWLLLCGVGYCVLCGLRRLMFVSCFYSFWMVFNVGEMVDIFSSIRFFYIK